MITPPRMAAQMFAQGTSQNFLGPDFFSLCQAVADAAGASVIGKTFQTIDSGLIIGIGVGIGTGIMGLIPSTIAAQIFQLSTSQGFVGPRLFDLCNLVAEALVQEMQLVTLVSHHFNVYQGVGQVVPGSIPVVGAEWGGNLLQMGVGEGMLGPRWSSFAQAVGNGSAEGFLTATGTVIISGSWIGLPIIGGNPVTVPGSGVGTGIVS